MAAKNDKQKKKVSKRIAEIKRRKASTQEGFSELVLNFCKPLLAEAHQLNGEDNAVGLGVFAWNASFLPKERWVQGLRNSLSQFQLSDEAYQTLEDIVAEMIRQKKLMFPDDMRVITNYDVQHEEGGIQLTVDAKLSKKAITKSAPGGDIAAETFGPAE